MTLLAEVIDGAAGDAPVATLLRKLKIVDTARINDLKEAGVADLAKDSAEGQPGCWNRVRAWLAAATTDISTGGTAVVIGTAASAFLGH